MVTKNSRCLILDFRFDLSGLEQLLLNTKQFLGFPFIVFFLTSYCSLNVYGQSAQVFIDLNVSPTKVYAGQPAILTYTVYTDQYFTQPPEVSNLQMDGAFLVPYDRSYSLTLQKGGKNMPAIQFKFRIFPVDAGKLTLPPLNFTVTVPTEKNPLGVERKVKSHGLTLNVLTPPGGPPGESIVGTSARLTEKWSKPLTTVKEGDVLERDITITAGGTVAGLLPEIKLDSLNWVQIYQGTPVTKGIRPPGSDNISAFRIEKFKYLFSQTGTFTIPEVKVKWWSLVTKKLTTLKIPEHKVVVTENKNLSVLRTMQDSLDKAFLKATDPHAPKQAPKTYWGLTPKQWLFIFLGVGILWFLVRRLIIPLIRGINNYYTLYRKKESYLFRKVKINALLNRQKNVYNYLQQWLITLPGEIKTLTDLSQETGITELSSINNSINNDLFKEGLTITNALKYSSLFPVLAKARQIQLAKYRITKQKFDYLQLNPIK